MWLWLFTLLAAPGLCDNTVGLIETAEKMYLVKIAKKTLVVTKIHSEMYDEL